MSALLHDLTLASAIGAGLISGVFFAFSTFVMAALARLPAAQGIAAMQAINITVINPLFLGAFLGTAALCLAVAAVSLADWSAAGGAWRLAGAVLYLVGNLLVTRFRNVPRNNALARLDPNGAGAADAWAGYLQTWNAWNHVRTVTALAAAACFMFALP